ncbi:MAG: TIGR04438 family Trp-rich protein [Burkholderiaceae bacterium]
MYLIWLGVALMLGKVLEFEPLAEMSWWWAVAPFAVAFVWFEGLEPALGFDKRKKQREAEDDQAKRERIQAQFAQPGQARKG